METSDVTGEGITINTNMTELSATSALVLLWAEQDCYKSDAAREYLSSLDLHPGEVLFDECNNICDYYNEVIINRKFGVMKLIRNSIDEHPDINQVIIAGAGLDALGIELQQTFRNSKIFELDNSNTDTKRELISELDKEILQNISLVNVDLQNTKEVYANLVGSGWDPTLSTILVLEGISYYLPAETIKNLIETLNPYRTIFEFLKSGEDIDPKITEIADKVFGLISYSCGSGEIVRYSKDIIESEFNTNVLSSLNMQQLELVRTGKNKYFPNAASGWIEVCLLG